MEVEDFDGEEVIPNIDHLPARRIFQFPGGLGIGEFDLVVNDSDMIYEYGLAHPKTVFVCCKF